ncbi:serine/arginine repetitive matrix protein 1-like [Haliotis rufescens]|uniref:serine/arginine repetitive matrix protein 1-like n=1 Tax=Haliotis rufescens TaxID=6454 RepID=UPI00201EDD23|nr:serine/arginine repetitive matrix protein 1-like [Haliotis rufescens]
MAALVVHFTWTVLFVLITELRVVSTSPLPVVQGLIGSPPPSVIDTVAFGRYGQHRSHNAIAKWDRPDVDSFKSMHLSQSHRKERKYTLTHSAVPHARMPNVQALDKVPAIPGPQRKVPIQRKTKENGTKGSPRLATGKSVKQIAEESRMRYEQHKPLINVVPPKHKTVHLEKPSNERKVSHNYDFKNILAKIMEISKALDTIATVFSNAKHDLNANYIDQFLNKHIGTVLNSYAQPQGLSTVYMPVTRRTHNHVSKRASGVPTPITLKDALAHLLSVSEREKGHIPRNLNPYQKIMANFAIKQKQMRSILAFIVNPLLFGSNKPYIGKNQPNSPRAQKQAPPTLTPLRNTQTPKRFRNQLVSFGSPRLTTGQLAHIQEQERIRNLVEQQRLSRGPFAAPAQTPNVNQNQGQTPPNPINNKQKQVRSNPPGRQSSSTKQPTRTSGPRSTPPPRSTGGMRQLPQRTNGQATPSRSPNRINQAQRTRSGQAPITRRRSVDQTTMSQDSARNQRQSNRQGVQTKPTPQNSNRQRIGTRQSNSLSSSNRPTPKPTTGRRQSPNQQTNSFGSSRSGQRKELISPASRITAPPRQSDQKGETSPQRNGFASSNHRQLNQKRPNIQMNTPQGSNRHQTLPQTDAFKGTKELSPQSTSAANQQRQSHGNSIRQNNQQPRQTNLPSQQPRMRSNVIENHKEPNSPKQQPNVHSRQHIANQRQSSAHHKAPKTVRQLERPTFNPGPQQPTNQNPQINQRKPVNRGIDRRTTLDPQATRDPSQVFVNNHVRSNPRETLLIRNHHPQNGKKVGISIGLGAQNGVSLTMKEPSDPMNFIHARTT